MRLVGEVAIVTGAGRGIGREIALTLALEGAMVALLARTDGELAAVTAEISGGGGVARLWPVDILDLTAVEKVVAAVEAELGAVSVLVNNAAAFTAIGPIWEVD